MERKRETSGFGSQPPSKRARIGSPAEAVGGTSLEVDPVDLVPNVLQALDTHNSDKLVSMLIKYALLSVKLKLFISVTYISVEDYGILVVVVKDYGKSCYARKMLVLGLSVLLLGIRI